MTGLASRDALPAMGGRIHLVGIGGAGMRGLAILLREAGWAVDGCDRGGEPLEDLAGRGIEVSAGHDPAHVDGAALVVRSSAVPVDAPEIAAAAAAGTPVLRRARALGALVNDRVLVGAAGTHGKTTITSMTGTAAEAAGLDPLVLVGGHVSRWEGFARPGAGPAVVEADEFDRSFLELDPHLAIVSSLEPEHLDTYGDFEGVKAAFRTFADRAGGRLGLLYCADDDGARDLFDALGRPATARSYGFADDADVRVEALGPRACRLHSEGGAYEVELRVPGRHNQQNAAAAFAACVALGGDRAAVAGGLAAYGGVGRRLEVLASGSGLVVIDDYAHHPTEVAASLAAVRAAYPGARLTVVFQPHLYTRTRDFAAAFAGALEAADEARVLPIYPAREAPIEGVTSELILRAAGERVRGIDREEARGLAGAGAGERVVVFMGAGDVTHIAHETARGLGGHVGA